MRELKKIAEQMEMCYNTEGNHLLSELYKFNLFSVGDYDLRKIENLLSKRIDNTEILIFDYDFQYSINANEQTVILFKSDELNLPFFSLRPRRLADRVFSVFKRKNIILDTNQKFSKLYYIQGDDENKVTDIFNNDKLLTIYEKYEKIYTEGDCDKLIFYIFHRKIRPDKLQIYLNKMTELFELFKNA